MHSYGKSTVRETGEPLLRFDAGHATRNDLGYGRIAARRRRTPATAAQVGVAGVLRVCDGDYGPEDLPRRSPHRVLCRFRNSLQMLSRIASDPLVWNADDAVVLSDLRETLHLTESALRQFEIPATERASAGESTAAILTLANLVEDRMDRLFERMEQLTALRQSLFQWSGILESVRNGHAPHLHDVDELVTSIVDVTNQEDRTVTLLDPGAADTPVRIAAHGINVAQIVVRLTSTAAAWRDEQSLSVAAALLMDLGMMRLPNELLESTELFSSPERTILQKHSEYSAAIVRQMHGHDPRWVDAVRQHHERLDGSGYPDRCRGDRVGPVARLLAVADTYVGIQSPRAYRPALSSTQALVEIDRAANEGRLDPAWTCRLVEIDAQWLKIPTTPEPPSGAPACSARAA